ncbi:MAG: HU family DNA-binding protein [Burkholderiales bacterium]
MATKTAAKTTAPAKKPAAKKAAAKTAVKAAPKKSAAAAGLTKAAFVELIAAQFGLPKSRSADVLDFVVDTIKKSLKKTGAVSISNFGTFKVAKRAARVARNPRTGESVKVKAAKTVRFKPTPGYKDTL